MRKDISTKVAETFVEILSKELAKGDFYELCFLTKQDEPWKQGICYSHNFCDANEVMYEAIRKHTSWEFDVNDSVYLTLWNMAWNKAQRMLAEKA